MPFSTNIFFIVWAVSIYRCLFALDQMLPAILLTFTSFLMDATSSPVYNMQPAYITANIGTTGRNIRNLPCISRKTSQSGVCMFAIDCLKSNGTHLGTCIDRFYFGSCCHIEPIRDIIDNNIDTSIFPEREPPERLSTTERTSTTVLEIKTRPTETPATSTTKAAISTIQTTRAPIILTKEPTTLETTLAPFKLSTYQSVDVITNDIITTIRPITTAKISIQSTTRPTSKPKPINATAIVLNAKPTFTTSNKPVINPKPTSKPTISSATKPTYRPVTTSKSPTTTLKPVSKPALTTSPIPVKLTHKTQKPTSTKIPSRPTRPFIKPNTTKATSKPFISTKPVTSTKRPYITTKQTQKPIETTRPPKPSKVVTKKPIITSTKPTTTAYSITTWIPITTKIESTQNTQTTPKIQPTTTPATIPIFPVVITKKPATTTKPTVEDISTKAPAEVISTSTPKIGTTSFVETTQQTHTTRITTRETTTPLPAPTTQSIVSATSQEVPEISSTAPNVTFSTVAVTSPPTKTTTAINISLILEDVNGNPATNEIDQRKPVVESTTKSSFVTWTVPSADNSTNVTNGDWVPITTPDGWIQVPTVSAVESPTNVSSAAGTSTIKLPTSTPTQEVTTGSENTTQNILTTLETSTVETNSTSTSTESSTSTSDAMGSSTTDIGESQINMTDFTDVCGRRMYPEGRIVGGEKASFGSWPWQISLRQWRTSTYLHKCGAALLNENWAITAAHCVDSVPPSDLLLRLGEHDLSTENEPYIHQERRVQIVASHPQFDPRTFEYDLALLRFYEPVKFQPNIIPVCVPQSDENFVGRTAYVTGWGRLYEDGPLPSILQEVSVPVINNTLCESMYRSAGYIEHIPHIFICAGWRRGGFDSCEGDSGGPMVIQRPDKRFLLAGVISWGIGCAEPNQPGVYTRISEFRDWINQILQF